MREAFGALFEGMGKRLRQILVLMVNIFDLSLCIVKCVLEGINGYIGKGKLLITEKYIVCVCKEETIVENIG